MNLKNKNLVVILLFIGMLTNTANQNYFNKLPKVIKNNIVQSFEIPLIDYPYITFKNLQELTQSNQILVSTTTLWEICENLNNLLNIKNSTAELNLLSKQKISDLLKFNIVNLVDNNGNTILHFACQKGYENVVKFLIDNGAKINVYATEIVSLTFKTKIRDKEISDETYRIVKQDLTCGATHLYCPRDRSKLLLFVEVINWHPLFDAFVNGNIHCAKLLLNYKLVNLDRCKALAVIKCTKCSYETDGILLFVGAEIDWYLGYFVNLKNRYEHNMDLIFQNIYEYSMDFDTPFEWRALYI